jgi:hypothetical protein
VKLVLGQATPAVFFGRPAGAFLFGKSLRTSVPAALDACTDEVNEPVGWELGRVLEGRV